MHLISRITLLFQRLEYYGWPFLLLAIRLSMGYLFWRSGKLKIKHFDATLDLFRFEYKVPLIPPDIAAYFTMAFEVVCPILLVLGLMTRVATIPLLLITGVIQMTYICHLDHLYWSLLLGVLLLKGAGAFSMDALWNRRYGFR
jgi:putative oxidoreductase